MGDVRGLPRSREGRGEEQSRPVAPHAGAEALAVRSAAGRAKTKRMRSPPCWGPILLLIFTAL